MDQGECINAMEAILFVAAQPMKLGDVKRVFERLWANDADDARQTKMQGLGQAWEGLLQRWGSGERGFELLEVAGGLTFRSKPTYGDVLRAMREEKPQRLTKPTLETLAIVAYRQPVTKPEVDHIRGVDCGGTLKALLDRNLVRIVGKKEEVGRPLLYGTSADFLSLFNLANLTQLPSLREFHELNEDSAAQVSALEGLPSLQELSQSVKQLKMEEEPAVAALQDAVKGLENAESSTRDAFAAQGIVLPGQEQESAAALEIETLPPLEEVSDQPEEKQEKQEVIGEATTSA